MAMLTDNSNGNNTGNINGNRNGTSVDNNSDNINGSRNDINTVALALLLVMTKVL